MLLFVCALLESISCLEPLITEPRYLKLVTVSSFCEYAVSQTLKHTPKIAGLFIESETFITKPGLKNRSFKALIKCNVISMKEKDMTTKRAVVRSDGTRAAVVRSVGTRVAVDRSDGTRVAVVRSDGTRVGDETLTDDTAGASLRMHDLDYLLTSETCGQ